MANWFLEYKGENKSFREWGLSTDFKPVLNSTALDYATLTDLTAAHDEDDKFEYGSTVIIRKDDEAFFSGRIVEPQPIAGPRMEAKTYKVVGPWYYLEEHTFQISIIIYALNFLTGKVGQTTEWSTHMLLNLKAGPLLATVREQVVAVIDYILSQYPAGSKPFQKGTILPGHAVYPPTKEALDQTCAQVVRDELTYAPDAVTWFDYSTVPPTLNIDVQANLAVETLVVDGKSIKDVSLKERKDLQRPCVAIRYETKATYNGEEKHSINTDIYPPDKTGRELHALTVTVPLQGVNVTTTKQPLSVKIIAALNVNADVQKGWWLARYPHLAGPNVRNLVISGAARTKGTFNPELPHEVAGGAITPWMVAEQGVKAEEVVYQCTASYELYNGATLQNMPANEPLSANFTATDGTNKTYEHVDSVEDGDPQPIGLAKFIYDALNIPQFEGTITIKTTEVGTNLRPGKAVNVLGSHPKYATMKAMIQGVSYDIDRGITSITVGPAGHLSIPDLVSLLKVGRVRRRSVPLKTFTEGELPSSGVTELGKDTANKDSTSSHGGFRYFTVLNGSNAIIADGVAGSLSIRDNSAAVAKGVSIDLASCVGSGVPRLLTVREVPVCERVGGVDTLRKKLFICSDTYD
jgi:hypothetical protein